MPLPLLLIGAGAALGVGLPAGWKLGRYIFGEDVEPDLTNIKETYNLQIKLLELSLNDGFLDKKIYAYYLYALITSQTELLIKLEKDLSSNTYLQYYKNTFTEWEELLTEISADVNDTLKRYLCYETFFKDIFGISYKEKDLDVIREKIVPFNFLTEKQVNDLILYIINPLFNGFFDFIAKNISVLKCIKVNILDPDKNICSTIIIKEFPLPNFAKQDYKEFLDHNEAVFDCVRPWILSNTILLKKQLSKSYKDEWMGWIDASISQFTGIDANYKIKAGKKVEELKDTAADWYDEMKNEFQDMRNSLNDLYSGSKSGLEGFAEALKWSAVAGGVLLAISFINGSESSE